MLHPVRCVIALALLLAPPLAAEVRNATPSNYKTIIKTLKPGDTLSLAPGKYPRLWIANLRGTPEAWITIAGPASDPPAVIEALPNFNTIEIENSSYVAIENLRIDSRGIPGAFGLSARGRSENLVHHIRVEGNTFVGQNGGQQTDAISTKTPTWGWVIRYNRILGAGTGIYLGDSDGNQPFVAGLIENNLIQDTIGYNIEIKHQRSLPEIEDMPLGPTSTIIRNNVFIKNDAPSPDGDRPTVLVDAFPPAGPGSLNLYEIYGNYFLHNHREALFQGAGRFTLHDNVFVDGPFSYPAIVVSKHNGPVKLALVYNNTIYTSGPGIRFSARGLSGDAVVGNLVFAPTPIAGPITQLADNVLAPFEKASEFVRAPSLDLTADFYPLPGKCQGPPIDLSIFHADTDYSLDFNGTPKVQGKGTVAFRGAYAGEGENPGWQLQGDLKPPPPPRRGSLVQLVYATPGKLTAGATQQVTLTGAGFPADAGVILSGAGIKVTKVTFNSETEIVATLAVARGATPGTRELTVSGADGSSNPLKLRVTGPGTSPAGK